MTAGGNIRIDRDRLWQMHMEVAEIGATAKGGSNRQALSDLDAECRALFRRWCEEAGCTVRVDAVGNMFARRAGRRDDLPPVLAGSHLDTQPTGGRFDGVFGVLAALEVVRTLNDHGIETEAAIEAVNWTNEEGSRFAPPMLGSGVFAGLISLEEARAKTDAEGVTAGAELDRLGLAGPEPIGGREIDSYFECHIEQGPILEDEGKSVGVVTGSQAMRWYEVAVAGSESHAGTTPPANRRDALVAAAKLIVEIDGIGRRRGVEGRATVGSMEVRPGSPNVVPGEVVFTVDFRNPSMAELDAMDRELQEAARGVGLDVTVTETWTSPPVAFDADCVEAVREGAKAGGHAWREIVSGAGHDAVNMSKQHPVAMIFVPCKDGISHNETEYAAPDDLAAGCDVLLRAVLARAGVA